MYNIDYPKFPYRICAKAVHDKEKAVQRDLCELWIHVKCNNLNYLYYRYLQDYDESWYCVEYCSTMFPFNSLSSKKNFLACCTSTDRNIMQWKDLGSDHNSLLLLKPSLILELSANQFKNTTPENGNDPEIISSSKHYGINEMHNIKIPHKNISRSLFYINACSLNKNYDDLQYLLRYTKKLFDIMAHFCTLLIIYCINVAIT